MVGNRARRANWQAAYAVRRDWPDGTHEFVGMRAARDRAVRFLAQDREYWRRGPWRPTVEVVEISGRDFDLHGRRRGCRAPDCPTGPLVILPEGARA